MKTEFTNRLQRDAGEYGYMQKQLEQTQPVSTVSTEVEEGNKWDKLNKEFDKVMDSITADEWKAFCDKWNAKVNKPSTPSVKEIDWEKEAEDRYPECEDSRKNVPVFSYQDMYQAERAAHIKACKLHSTDGIDELIEWCSTTGYMTGIHWQTLLGIVKDKAKEIKSSLNK